MKTLFATNYYVIGTNKDLKLFSEILAANIPVLTEHLEKQGKTIIPDIVELMVAKEVANFLNLDFHNNIKDIKL